MSGNNSNALQPCTKSFPERPRSLTPSVLGVANSHGVKFSLHMTSEDRKELMSKLEEWRKARRDKLAARILTKQKQSEKPEALVTALPPRIRPPSFQSDGALKSQDRQSVFERLYNNNNNKSRIKKPDASSTLSRPRSLPKTNSREIGLSNPGRQKKPLDLSLADAVARRESEFLANEGVAKSSEPNSESIPESESESTEGTVSSACVECVGVSEEKPAEIEMRPVEVVPEASREIERSVSKNLAAEIPVDSRKTEKRQQPLRRSVSMMFRQKCRNENALRRSFSAKNLKELSLEQRTSLNRAGAPPARRPANDRAKEGKSKAPPKSVSFVTPKPHKPLGPSTLRTKLEDWLKVNGHSLDGYRHLRCFGVAASENSLPPTAPPPLDHSFETSYYATAPNTPGNDSDKENVTPPTVVHQVDTKEVENWLRELHRLIVELKYPAERCEEWLTAIRRKCGACCQLPIFWECLAALDESKGDLTSAIEDYERAIIKGGEVDAVGNSLAQLFEKMVIEQRHHPKPKMEKGIDPKNIFKSTIIKFALQQKALKKLSSELDPDVRQQLYVATPVRRSTRIQIPHKSGGGEVTSLRTLTPELRKNVIFKPNESLLGGD